MFIEKTFGFALALVDYKLRFKVESPIEGLPKEYFIILFVYVFTNAISVMFNASSVS